MTKDDRSRFFQALDTLAEFFGDDLSALRQQLYWEAFASHTIDAWEYACQQAVKTHAFHKVPLPAVLMPSVVEFEELDRFLTTPLLDDPDAYERQRAQDRALALAQIERDERILARGKRLAHEPVTDNERSHEAD